MTWVWILLGFAGFSLLLRALDDLGGPDFTDGCLLVLIVILCIVGVVVHE